MNAPATGRQTRRPPPGAGQLALLALLFEFCCLVAASATALLFSSVDLILSELHSFVADPAGAARLEGWQVALAAAIAVSSLGGLIYTLGKIRHSGRSARANAALAAVCGALTGPFVWMCCFCWLAGPIVCSGAHSVWETCTASPPPPIPDDLARPADWHQRRKRGQRGKRG